MNKKIVVIGGGYAGTEVIRQLMRKGLRNIEIELISNKRYFENIVGSTEIISEKIKAEELTYDLEELSNYWDFELTIGNVENIDLIRKKVKIGRKEKDYDVLVVATGAESNFSNIRGSNLALPAYNLSDFRIIKNKLKLLNKDYPNIVIVGAGFVGLQTAAEILDLFKIMDKKVKITVVEKMNSILPLYNNNLARRLAFEQLSSRGVKFILGNGVKRIEKGKCFLEDGSNLEADLTIWSAGIKSSKITSKIVGANLHEGFIEVDEKLLIKGRDNAFAIGDAAFVQINGKVAQKMAAEALEQAETLAKNIILSANGQKPRFNHIINYPTDLPKAFLSLGERKAILIGSKLLLGSVRSFPRLIKQVLRLPGAKRVRNIFSKVMAGPQVASMGTAEYLLKKRIIEEIMERFPESGSLARAEIQQVRRKMAAVSEQI